MDKITAERRSENMRRIVSKNTSPELRVRKIIRQLGYRYRIHAKSLPGKPDLVFPALRKAIFVHGCFWHLHPCPTCKDARIPKSRVEYWTEKLDRNTKRDREHLSALRKMGWKAMVIWECQIGRSEKRLTGRITKFLAG